MKILVCVLTYNQGEMIPFFLRNCSTFADEIWAWDDRSDDETGQILNSWPNVKLEEWPHPGSGIEEDLFLNFAYKQYPKAVGKFDWVIWLDPDEILYHPNIRQALADCIGKYDVLKTCGYNMVGAPFPKDDGRQIWEIFQTGVRGPVYGKPIIFNPACKIIWHRGKHHLVNTGLRVSPNAVVKLLHYKYLDEDYTRYRNAKNLARCGLRNNDKSAAWTCLESWKGEGSPEWVGLARKEMFNVVEAEMYA